MHYPDLVTVLKNRREELGVTQEYLAELAGVGLRTLKKIESGKGNPTVETLGKLADILGMELNLVVRKPN
jgi:transcriptional regulator with XRE-family HTH domain